MMAKTFPGHSPHGECGLKFLRNGLIVCPTLSLPTRGVWIEIGNLENISIDRQTVTPHTGSVD